MEEGVVRHEVLSRNVSVKVPTLCPGQWPRGREQLLSVIDNTRNRAMVLMLLRTGMRIGEFLALRIQDIDLSEQKVFIHEARKTGTGRVVYFSSDAKVPWSPGWSKKIREKTCSPTEGNMRASPMLRRGRCLSNT